MAKQWQEGGLPGNMEAPGPLPMCLFKAPQRWTESGITLLDLDLLS